MDSIRQLNPDLGTIAWSAFLIDQVHRCADCPIRHAAVRRPKSIFTRIHTWHKSWWPGWKAHEARACALRTRAVTRA